MIKIKINWKLIISFILALIWGIIIYNFSEMNGTESNSKSTSTIDVFITKMAEISNDFGITHVNTQSAKKNPIIIFLNKYLRKCMHAGEFFILSILCIAIIKQFNVSDKKTYLLTIILVFIYACLDEYHQTFVAGRTRTI